VQIQPPRGIGSVPSDGTLEFMFTAPTGGVNVGQVTPEAIPSVIVLPGKAAAALVPGATGSGRPPLLATGSPSPTSSPSPDGAAFDSDPSALATPASPGMQPGAIAGAAALGLGALGIATVAGRRAFGRGK
jgi:hypothetical protein